MVRVLALAMSVLYPVRRKEVRRMVAWIEALTVAIYSVTRSPKDAQRDNKVKIGNIDAVDLRRWLLLVRKRDAGMVGT